jgi:hypothetical protein
VINHVRTLLLNSNREIDPSFPGEEYVPDDYTPVVLTPVLGKVHSILFGSNPDRYMLNYRLQQIMSALHSTELDEHVRDFDSRITYWPQTTEVFYNFSFNTTAKQESSFTGHFNAVNTLLPNTAAGTVHFLWRVSVTDADTVTVQNLIPPLETQESSYTITNGSSEPIPLVGSTQSFKFNGPVGASWIVEGFARPQRDMGTVLADLTSGIGITDEPLLFGASPAEPMLTYKNLWKQHDVYAYRLGGVVLALATQIEALRSKGI